MIDWYVGQPVTRWLGGRSGVKMALRVTKVEPHAITCVLADDAESTAWSTPNWTFDPATGAEIDDYLNWGPPPLVTGSFIEAVPSTKEGTNG